jgi:hypothetical protein
MFLLLLDVYVVNKVPHLAVSITGSVSHGPWKT